mgnify:FL=1
MSERLKAMQQDREKFPLTLPGLGEGEDKDLHCFFYKLTVRDDEKLRKRHKTFYKDLTDGDVPSFSAMVDLMLIKLVDDEGVIIFQEGDRMFLNGLDVGYVTNVATKMMPNLFDNDSVETAEGNSKAVG